MIGQALEKLLQNEDLTRQEATELMSEIASGKVPPVRIAALLTALRMKGETVAEIAGFASSMREFAVRITPATEGLIDTCGTGGDAKGTFNISTATALVAAAMDIPIAKHGNRAVSSQCGSADVLEALDVNLDLAPAQVAELIDRVGIGFLFAPVHHPAMRHVAPVRKELGMRTIFNVLGPLTNPAGVKRQLLGVFAEHLAEVMCRVLGELGAEKAFVVHGADGNDELSITGETTVAALDAGQILCYRFSPEQAGLERAEAETLAGGSAEENAGLIREILDGVEGPRTDAVLLNAGFVAVLADRAATPEAGVALARETINSGHARRLLQQLREHSQRLAKES